MRVRGHFDVTVVKLSSGTIYSPKYYPVCPVVVTIESDMQLNDIILFPPTNDRFSESEQGNKHQLLKKDPNHTRKIQNY